jgi:hypothetical protein
LPKQPSWSEAELTALAKVPPNDRAALARYRAEFPGHKPEAVSAMLMKLRIRGAAKDFVNRIGTGSPFPIYRFD